MIATRCTYIPSQYACDSALCYFFMSFSFVDDAGVFSETNLFCCCYHYSQLNFIHSFNRQFIQVSIAMLNLIKWNGDSTTCAIIRNSEQYTNFITSKLFDNRKTEHKINAKLNKTAKWVEFVWREKKTEWNVEEWWLRVTEHEKCRHVKFQIRRTHLNCLNSQNYRNKNWLSEYKISKSNCFIWL